MQQKMGVDDDGEFKLYEVDKQEEQIISRYDIFSTMTFEIKMKVGRLQKYRDKLDKRDKFNQLKIPQSEHFSRKRDFIQQKMRPIDPNLSGEDYERSREAFMKVMFPEEMVELRRQKSLDSYNGQDTKDLEEEQSSVDGQDEQESVPESN